MVAANQDDSVRGRRQLYADIVVNISVALFAGSAYVFAYSGGKWSQQQKLLASSGVSNDRFGSALSIYENIILLGAHWVNNFVGM